MKKIFFKELREQLPLTLIGLAVFSLLLMVGYASCMEATQRAVLGGGYVSGDGLHPLLSEGGRVQTAVLCALFAALLGWFQIRAEKHPDLWAFLIHRPIDPMMILRGKVLAGLLLYGGAAGIPLLALVLATARPGGVAAPFEWSMARPLGAVFLAGFPFYGAGLLTGLRKARWYGSRGIGLGPAIVAMFGSVVLPKFPWALLVIGIAMLLVGLAVWGSFKTGGFYRGQPGLAKGAMALSSAVSMLLVLALVTGFLVNLFSASRSVSYSQYYVLNSGQVVKVSHHGGAEETEEITDLAGMPLNDPKTGRAMTMKELQTQTARGISSPVNFEGVTRPMGYAQAGSYFQSWRSVNKVLWYMTADGRLEGYHGITRRRVGILVPTSPGESTFLRPANYYAGYFQPYDQPLVLASSRRLYLVNLAEQEIKPFFVPPEGGVIGGFAQELSPNSLTATNTTMVVTRTAIFLIDGEGKPILQTPYEPSYPQYTSVNAYRSEGTNSFVVRIDPDYLENRKAGGNLVSHVKWFGPDGRITDSRALPKVPEPRAETAWEVIVTTVLPPVVPTNGENVPLPITILRLAIAVVCAGITWLAARRDRFPLGATLGWVAFQLLFGIIGFLTFLALQEWPAREPCPRCGRRRVVNRETCEFCQAGFASPPKVGIEIFEPLVAP